MQGASEMLTLEKILEELCCLAIREQQLENRRAILTKQKEFSKKYTRNEENEGPSELRRIDEELETLSKRKEDLVTNKNKILRKRQEPSTPQTVIERKDDCIPNSTGECILPCTTENVSKIGPPPSMQAQQVIVDVERLPAWPSQTQCPSCQQFITTETFCRVGNITWLMCLMSLVLGCVAGCCLFPFCMDSAKDVVHRCPKCQKQIHTVKKL